MKPLNLLASCIAALSLAACSSSGGSSPGVAGNANPGTGGGNIGTSPGGGGNGSTTPAIPGSRDNEIPTGPGAGNANPGTGGGNIGTSPVGGGNGSTTPAIPGSRDNEIPTGPGAGNANPGTGGGNIGTSPVGGGNGSTTPAIPGSRDNEIPTGPGAGNANPTPTDPTPTPDPDLSDVQGNLLRTLTGKESDSADIKFNKIHSYLQSDNINTVLLDGEKITLIPACYFSGQGCVAGMAGPDYRRIDPKDDENKAVTDHSKMYYNWRRNRDGEPIQKTVASKHLNYARYGWVYFYPPDDDRDYVGREYFFAHGQPTELAGKDAMPVEGKAVYRGYALVSYGSSPTSFAPSRYDARFNVDFGAKTLSGKLNADKEDYMSSVEFKAKINGNTFSGDTAYPDKSNNYNVGVYTEGGFYGPQAQELSGVFSGRAAGIWDFPAFKGSFGASKQ